MQIQLIMGVNIRLHFQIDIKYSQVLFCPKSSSHQGKQGLGEDGSVHDIQGVCHLPNLRLHHQRWAMPGGDGGVFESSGSPWFQYPAPNFLPPIFCCQFSASILTKSIFLPQSKGQVHSLWDPQCTPTTYVQMGWWSWGRWLLFRLKHLWRHLNLLFLTGSSWIDLLWLSLKSQRGSSSPQMLEELPWHEQDEIPSQCKGAGVLLSRKAIPNKSRHRKH